MSKLDDQTKAKQKEIINKNRQKSGRFGFGKGEGFKTPTAASPKGFNSVVEAKTSTTPVELAREKFLKVYSPDVTRGDAYCKNRIELPKGITLNLPEVGFDYKDHPTAEAYPIGIVAQVMLSGSSRIITIYKSEEDNPEGYRDDWQGKEFFKPDSSGVTPSEWVMGPGATFFQIHDTALDGDLQEAMNNTDYSYDNFNRVGGVKGSPENLLPDAIRVAIKLAQQHVKE